MSRTPEWLSVFRRLGAEKLHVGEDGETMSWGNSEGGRYIRKDAHQAALAAARAEERERAARIADRERFGAKPHGANYTWGCKDTAKVIAAAIRTTEQEGKG